MMRRMGTKPAVAVFLLLFAWLCVSALLRESPTYDETTHLVAGYSYDRWNDYRLNPEHPPLLKRLAALPLLLARIWPESPEPGARSSTAGDSLARHALQTRWALVLLQNDNQWIFAHEFLDGIRDDALRRAGASGALAVPGTALLERGDFLNDSEALFRRARLAMLPLALLLGLLVFLWSRELFGTSGAFVSLALFSFDPNILAHTGLVTTDIGVTLFLFGTLYFFWRACRHGRLADSTLTILFFAAAVASKFSALLLLPMLILAGLVRRRRAALLLLACAIGGYTLLWASYGFRFSAARDPGSAARAELAAALETRTPRPAEREPGHPGLLPVLREAAGEEEPAAEDSSGTPAVPLAVHRPLPFTARLLLMADRAHLLPESYLFGLAFVRTASIDRMGYLLGHYSRGGFWYYFPAVFVLKTPLVTLAALIAAGAFLWRRRTLARRDLPFLLGPVAIYLAVSMLSHLNIGVRHLLPVYPFLFVLCGILGKVWEDLAPRRRRIVAVAALGILLFNTNVVLRGPALVWPHYIAYFNEIAGGPANGYHCLADSNVDWGQDLKALGSWLDAHKVAQPINLCYFGTADPHRYNIRYRNLPGSSCWTPVNLFDTVPPGWVVISATDLLGVYFMPELREAWREFLEPARQVDTIGNSLLVFRRD